MCAKMAAVCSLYSLDSFVRLFVFRLEKLKMNESGKDVDIKCEENGWRTELQQYTLFVGYKRQAKRVRDWKRAPNAKTALTTGSKWPMLKLANKKREY